MQSGFTSWGYFPSEILETDFAVGNFWGSCRIVNDSRDIDFVTRLYKVFIASYGDFDHSVAFTATTLRIGNLFSLNCTCNLSAGLHNVEIFSECLNVIFIIRWNELCDKLVSNVSIFWLEKGASKFRRENKLEGERVMPSRKNPFWKYSQLKTGVISDFGIRVVSSMLSWTLRPSDMFNALQSQLE